MQLWKHQQLAIEKARSTLNLALFFDVGTGKTATMINILREEYAFNKSIVNTLIYCPLTICAQWKTEFERFSKVNQDQILVLTGTGKSRVDALRKARATGRQFIVITNYESVQIELFYQEILALSPKILVCDESQKLKDPASVRSKKIFPIAQECSRRFLLTGTPILNSMLDIFGQFKILDSKVFGTSFWSFRQKYFYDKNAGMPSHVHFPDWQPRPESAGEIGAKIASISCQARKHECLDLPPLTKIVIPVELSPDQRKVYEDMRRYFVAEVNGSFMSAEFAMTKVMRMQQVMAGFSQPDDSENVIRFKDNARLKALEELLESMGKEKVIVWTVFKATYRDIAQVCDKLGLKHAPLTGEQSINEKNFNVHNFRVGDTQVLIANPAAGGTGINLTEAKYAIYYTRSYSLEQYLQSEARNFRGGSEMHDKITHYHLVAKDTLDEIIMQALLNKQNVAEKVLAHARNNLQQASVSDNQQTRRKIL